MKSWCLLALVVALFVLLSCQEAASLYDFDEDGSLDGDDCAPSDPLIHPGAPDPHGDGIDQDCDGADGDAGDLDNDGVPNESDCDPEDSTVYPGADDPYGDGIDQDCDGGDGIDSDGDGYPANEGLEDEPFYDCNDNNAAVHPGAAELPNDGIDNDCSGDEAVDADGDGHNAGITDCDDDDPSVYLGATEVADGVDNDCDTQVDEGTEAADDDLDGYCEGFDLDGDGNLECWNDAQPGDCDDNDNLLNLDDSDLDGLTSCNGDCDDHNASRALGLAEICDGQDNDCDLLLPVNEQDIDGDNVMGCLGDCDDLVATTFPGATEECNLVDDDCDNSVDEGFDVDGDETTTCGDDGVAGTADDDCDDNNLLISPTEPEVCDLIDNDCDPTTGDPGDGIDVDGDGHAACSDCDDDSATVFVGAVEVPYDGIDQDCDGTDLVDVDLDGYPGSPALAGLDPNWDCNDNNPNWYPGATDGYGNVFDEDCDNCVDPDPSDSVFPGDGIDADCDGFAYNAPGSDWDCDDTLATTFPGAPELCNGDAEDCIGLWWPAAPEDELDTDGDQYVGCSVWVGPSNSGITGGGDCFPEDISSYPGAPEQCTGLDNDCDPSTDENTDGDGDTFSACQGDCDDTDPALSPAATEVALDGIDQDCNGRDLVPFLQVAAGYASNSCGIDSFGQLHCWGQSSTTWLSPPSGSYTQISAGLNHYCALSTSGSVVCWGLSDGGAFDWGQVTGAPTNGTFTQLSAGYNHNCALDTGGALHCWGRGSGVSQEDCDWPPPYRDCGQSLAPPGTYSQAALGDDLSCALQPNGEVYCWGYSVNGGANPPAGPFSQISGGRWFGCGIHDDGSDSLQCWGVEEDGQLLAPTGPFTQVSAGKAHGCAVNSGGTVQCWGSNNGGGTQAPSGIFTQVSAGGDHTCAIALNGSVECWGGEGAGESSPP